MDQSNKLTKGEVLFVLRRRRRTTQAQEAELMGVSRNCYGALERDDSLCDTDFSELKLHERCAVLRRRGNHSQQYIADKIGITRAWLIKMETGKANCYRLFIYWQGRWNDTEDDIW